MKKDSNKKARDKDALKNKEKRAKSEYYPDISNVSSMSDCTGLMHTPPQNDEEYQAYQDLSNMQIPKQDD
ncbi:MAG: hypothetical protein LBH71_00800 [Oscillospiraceae bacterium]|jgi:hypothetical protein|nr:hypothetical protein [Oscillospiraceae bacterium]